MFSSRGGKLGGDNRGKRRSTRGHNERAVPGARGKGKGAFLTHRGLIFKKGMGCTKKIGKNSSREGAAKGVGGGSGKRASPDLNVVDRGEGEGKEKRVKRVGAELARTYLGGHARDTAEQG